MKKIFLLLTLISLAFTSCEDYIADINIDPNAPQDADARNMIQGVMLSNQFWANSDANRLMMIWMNQATGADRQYVALNNWNNSTATDMDGAWAEAYAGTIGQAKLAAEKALLEGNPWLAGVAQVLQAHSQGMVAALWGDVPFTQAGDYANFPNPAYDSQASVYTGVQTLLNTAIANLSKSNSVAIPSDKDIYYGGNKAQWIKLAYSLKARFFLHVKNYPSAYTNSLLGMTSSNDDFKARFGTSYGNSFNPFYSFLVYDRSGYMSAEDSYGASLLEPGSANYRGNAKTNESLRYEFNYLDYWGYYNSGQELNFNSDFDGWGAGDGKFGGESDVPLVTYGEMLLIQTEYQARTNGLSAGVTAYNTYRALLRTGYSIGTYDDGFSDYFGGNTASTKYLNYADADFAALGMENSDSTAPLNAFLRELYQERYVYFIGHFESFNDFRRTNNIAKIVLKPGFSNTPQRLLYPQSEVNSNSNVPSPIPTIEQKTPVNQ
jgi:hypothetical protein